MLFRSAGESVGVAQQLGLAADLLHQVVGELLGQIHGLALGQIDEYIPNVAGLVGEVDPGQHVGRVLRRRQRRRLLRSEEHTSELQSLMRISYAVFCLKKKKHKYYTRRTVRNITARPI